MSASRSTDPSEIAQNRGEGKTTWHWSADTRRWLRGTGCERLIFFDASTASWAAKAAGDLSF